MCNWQTIYTGKLWAGDFDLVVYDFFGTTLTLLLFSRYLKVELQDPTHGVRYREVFSALKARLSDTAFTTSDQHDRAHDSASTPFKSIVDSVSKLGTPFRGSDGGTAERDRSVKKGAKQLSVWDVLLAQDSFISGIMDIQLRCRDARGKKDVKEAQLKSLLSKEGYDRKAQRYPVPLPSAPDLLVNGVLPDTAKMFKSTLYPALIEFHVEGTLKSRWSTLSKGQRPENPLTSYKVIVKTGDDLRQDQLIIMVIQLMDGLLKRGALDLCLTPYAIIAMSPTSGLVEFVDGAIPISQVLSKYNGSIMQFFQATAPQKGAKYDVRPDVMSTYVRSCAGYCVITFLLGVGDRHLDNILLRATGHFFHIDFGFIFGRDPKPLPPAFRLTREVSNRI
jgi:phosphatidylinositol 3-kinase